jgi:hypothetical protein
MEQMRTNSPQSFIKLISEEMFCLVSYGRNGRDNNLNPTEKD